MELYKMRKISKDSQYSDVLYQLKCLTAEDRMLLGLYIYEGLSSEEVSKILNSKTKSPGTAKKVNKTARRSRYTV
jgi:hypothetical protein